MRVISLREKQIGPLQLEALLDCLSEGDIGISRLDLS